MPNEQSAPSEDLREAIEATKLVAYQSDSVVSRSLLHQTGGTVTAFAFDAGQGLSEHQAPFDALVMVLDGRAEITVGGTPHQVNGGEMIQLPANVPHAVHAVERFKMVLVMIRSK